MLVLRDRIGEHCATGQRGSAAIDPHRAARNQGGLHRTVKSVRAFACVPAVVSTRHDDVDFLHLILAHIRGEKTSAPASADIEGKPPSVAQTIGIDFLAHSAACTDERVRRRNAVLPAWAIRAERIDAMDFPVKPGLVLRVAKIACGRWIGRTIVTKVDVVRAATIACAEIEIAIGPKLKLAAVVIRLRFVECQQHTLGREVANIGIIRNLKLRNRRPAIHRNRTGRGRSRIPARIRRRSAVEDIELPITRRLRIGISRMKCEPEQTPLVIVRIQRKKVRRRRERDDLRRNIEERLRKHHPVLDDVDLPGLVADKEPATSIGSIRDRGRRLDLLKTDRLERNSRESGPGICQCKECRGKDSETKGGGGGHERVALGLWFSGERCGGV